MFKLQHLIRENTEALAESITREQVGFQGGGKEREERMRRRLAPSFALHAVGTDNGDSTETAIDKEGFKPPAHRKRKLRA